MERQADHSLLKVKGRVKGAWKAVLLQEVRGDCRGEEFPVHALSHLGRNAMTPLSPRPTFVFDACCREPSTRCTFRGSTARQGSGISGW